MKNYMYALFLVALALVAGCSSMDTTAVVRPEHRTPNNHGKFGQNNPAEYEVYNMVGKPAWLVEIFFRDPVENLNFGIDMRSASGDNYSPERLKMVRHTRSDDMKVHAFEVMKLADCEADLADYVLTFEADQSDVMLSSIRSSSDENSFDFVLTRDGFYSKGDFNAAYTLTLRNRPAQPLTPAPLPTETAEDDSGLSTMPARDRRSGIPEPQHLPLSMRREDPDSGIATLARARK